MIKFFRRIRQRLLSENRFRKYLLYAIGEVILVVIGILIALQINNWNEDQKDQKETGKLIASLKQDLETDITQLEEVMGSLKFRIDQTQNWIDRYNAPEATLDTLIQIAREVDLRYTFYDYQTSAYDAMVSSGKINLLPGSLRAKLARLHSLQELLNSTSDRYDRRVERYLASYAFGEKVQQLDNLMYELAWQIENPREFAMLLESVCHFKLLTMRRLVSDYTRVYEKSQEILGLLNALEQSP